MLVPHLSHSRFLSVHGTSSGTASGTAAAADGHVGAAPGIDSGTEITLALGLGFLVPHLFHFRFLSVLGTSLGTDSGTVAGVAVPVGAATDTAFGIGIIAALGLCCLRIHPFRHDVHTSRRNGFGTALSCNNRACNADGISDDTHSICAANQD